MQERTVDESNPPTVLSVHLNCPFTHEVKPLRVDLTADFHVSQMRHANYHIKNPF